MSQQTLAFIIVGFAAVGVGAGAYRKYLSRPLSDWLLKRGHVKLAMRLRFGKKRDCCGP